MERRLAIAYRVRERISHDLGTAVNVQTMVFGNRDDNSGTGVGFTRNAATGENKPYGDFLINAQGEDVVAGIRNTEDLDYMAEQFPKIHKELLRIFDRLEAHYRDMCDTEFTIEQGKLWMLQTRGQADRCRRPPHGGGDDQGSKWKIKEERSCASPRTTSSRCCTRTSPGPEAAELITHGLAASPGAAVGRVYFTADDAVDASERARSVILVRSETSPEDIHGMVVAEGILTARRPRQPRRGRGPWLGQAGGRGAESIRIAAGRFVSGDTSSCTRATSSPSGSVGFVAAGIPARPEASAHLATVLDWADDVRKGKLAVGPTPTTAPTPRRPPVRRRGHRPLPHRAHVPRRGPVAHRPAHDPGRHCQRGPPRRGAARRPEGRLRGDPRGDGRPARHRAPARSAAPRVPSSTEELPKEEATVGLTDEETELYNAAKSWHEFNPMLGTRGVRLGVIKPGLYAMQVRALMEAAAERVKKAATRSSRS